MLTPFSLAFRRSIATVLLASRTTSIRNRAAARLAPSTAFIAREDWRDDAKYPSTELQAPSIGATSKNALASLRISLVRRGSLTSRSRALMRSRPAALTPSRSPRSTSSRLTQSSSVCGLQPIIGAIDSTAAQTKREFARVPRFRLPGTSLQPS